MLRTRGPPSGPARLHFMVLLLQSILNGVLTGGVYALVGVGLALTVGAIRVLNLAHGELVMLGSYAAWALFAQLGLEPYLSILLVAPLLFLLGLALRLVLACRAQAALPRNQLLLTVGMGLVMSGVVAVGFGSEHRTLTTALSETRFELLGLSLSEPLLVAFAAAVAVASALGLFLRRRDAGRVLRAVAQDREAAQLAGIDVRRTSVVAFGLGAALAGAAGALIAPTSPIFPQAGDAFTLRALVILLLGGTGSLAGAVVGGVLLGVAESLTAAWLGNGVEDLAVVVLLLALILVRPSRLPGPSRA
jgi:branched-chain amino acid transport system permease protein